MELGERIAHYRKSRNWTQDEFAAKIGVHGRHVSRWETGRVKPSIKLLSKIATELGVSLDELTSETWEAPNAIVNSDDPELFRWLKEVQSLDDEDRFVVRKVIEAMLTKKRVRRALEAS